MCHAPMPRPRIGPYSEANPASRETKGTIMLKWALIFAVISLLAGVLGFTGVAAGAAGIAKILFLVFLVIFLVLLGVALLGANALRK